MNKRIPELDVMRTVAISIILLHHLPSHSANFYDFRSFGIALDLSWLNDLNRYFGLGLFVFISGFLLQKGVHDFSNLAKIKSFLLKKYIRILPLYLVALALFIICFGDLIGPINASCVLIHVLGLQALLASTICTPIFTIWYVGLVLAYYFAFVCCEKFGTDIYRFLTLVVLLPLVCSLFMIIFGIMDKRFLVYYVPFMSGVMSEKWDLLDRFSRYRSVLLFCIVSILVSAWLYCNVIYPNISDPSLKPGVFSKIGLTTFIVSNVAMICFTYTIFILSKGVTGAAKPMRIITAVSYSSYAIFLFHRPIWFILSKIYEPISPMGSVFYAALVGIPVIVFVSYWVQKGYDMMVPLMSSKLESVGLLTK